MSQILLKISCEYMAGCHVDSTRSFFASIHKISLEFTPKFSYIVKVIVFYLESDLILRMSILDDSITTILRVL